RRQTTGVGLHAEDAVGPRIFERRVDFRLTRPSLSSEPCRRGSLRCGGLRRRKVVGMTREDEERFRAQQPSLHQTFLASRENVERSMQIRPILDAKGEPTGEYRWDGSVANKALELLGKELGMFVEKRVIDQSITVTEQQRDEADRILADSM